MLKVAITGNIASGKSAVEKYLEEKGFWVFDTDKMSHEILDNSFEIKELFKNYDILTQNKIDRKKIAKIVFSDKNLLKKLEQIIHPQVKQKILEIFENYKDEQVVFISVPQLFETDFEKLFDKVILVSAKEEIRIERLMQRNGLSKTDALERINAQLSEENKKEKSDFILENNSTIENLHSQIDKIISGNL